MSECRVSQKELIEQITDRIGLLTNSIPQWAKVKLNKISEQWDVGVQEIEDLGEVTLVSCMAMSRMLTAAEEDAKRRLKKEFGQETWNWHLGLRLIHDNMTWLMPEGGEGPKDCEPWC